MKLHSSLWSCLLLPFIALGSWLVVFFSTSHLPPKPVLVKVQLRVLQDYADEFKEPLLKVPSLNAVKFISIVKPEGFAWKYNNKGEVLDPWGQPFVISQNNGQITITSPGLDKYNKLSTFQKWWSNE